MQHGIRLAIATCLVGLILTSSGCQVINCNGRHVMQAQVQAQSCHMPRELCKGILPTYKLEPPDILAIEAVHLVPSASYRLRTFDVLALDVKGTVPETPIQGEYQVQPSGAINLGYEYGSLKVVGMTIQEVEQALTEKLRELLKQPEVSVTLASSAPAQQVSGQHLVGPDGNVVLGSYGSVLVVGMTIAEAKQAIESHLSEYFDEPEVAVDVYAYNSKMYYIVTQGGGLGDRVIRLPITGNETVLDAISQINGLEQVSSKRIWIARPGRNSEGRDQILTVDWDAIAQLGEVETNYQILPGDRVYVAEDKLVALDACLAKVIAPVERVMGFTLLGTETATRLSGKVLRGGGNPRGSGGY